VSPPPPPTVPVTAPGVTGPAGVPPETKKEELPAIHIGIGVRAGLGESQKQTQLDTLDVRPYISGQVHKYIKFTANLDSNDPMSAPNLQLIRVLDAIGQFEFDDLFNVWIGRFLPPTDRPNLSGPYFQNSWRFPATSRFPQIYAGRDDGAAIWGQVGGGRFKYQVGGFDGGIADSLDAWRYAGRLVVNFLDPEPGYYNSSTYYGQKDILALGGVIQYQHDHIYVPAVLPGITLPGGTPIGTPAVRDDFFAFSLDLLFEKNLNEAGVPTLEAEYYNFAKGRDGSSFMVLGSYLIPTVVGIGRFQPDVRYQYWGHDTIPSGTVPGGATEQILDAGVNYIIDGHNLRMAANYWRDWLDNGGPTIDGVQIGVQIQK
jgi:hypothetical protein